uniref:Major facilitator superfamily (MFS) profile domain-containing protein n=1 Tax=Arcella intermedia TaxID=1963864 RepID=A0A6B2L1I2_9EUKA
MVDEDTNTVPKPNCYSSPWFKILVVSVGFMIDAYDLFIFGMVIIIMGKLNPNDNTTTAKAVLGVSIIMGTVVGQLLFGTFGDLFGRRRVFIATLSLIIVFTFCSAFAFSINDTYYISLTIMRILLGIGIGGEYPLSATIAAESSPNVERRGCMMATVFSMQGIGNFLAPVVVCLLLLSGLPLDTIWRCALGFGAIPGVGILYWRLKLEETYHPPSITTLSTKDLSSPPSSPTLKFALKPEAEMPSTFLESIRMYIWPLIGTTLSWFLFDIAFYGNGFFKETVIIIFGLSTSSNHTLLNDTYPLQPSWWSTPNLQQEQMRAEIAKTTIASLIIAGMALPGYWCSVFLIEAIGRKKLQIAGFLLEAIIFLVMGIFYKQIQDVPILFVLLYGLTFFFSNAGPNTTTYVLAAEAFPKRIRSTCHGISSASGKLGALFGVAVFPSFVAALGVPAVFIFCGVVLVVGFVVTVIFIPETKGKDMDTEEFEKVDEQSIEEEEKSVVLEGEEKDSLDSD